MTGSPTRGIGQIGTQPERAAEHQTDPVPYLPDDRNMRKMPKYASLFKVSKSPAKEGSPEAKSLTVVPSKCHGLYSTMAKPAEGQTPFVVFKQFNTRQNYFKVDKNEDINGAQKQMK